MDGKGKRNKKKKTKTKTTERNKAREYEESTGLDWNLTFCALATKLATTRGRLL
jgi:hypothetical protein